MFILFCDKILTSVMLLINITNDGYIEHMQYLLENNKNFYNLISIKSAISNVAIFFFAGKITSREAWCFFCPRWEAW